jgi:hypothetical protein
MRLQWLMSVNARAAVDDAKMLVKLQQASILCLTKNMVRHTP